MKYMGSKNRHSKYIVPIIQRLLTPSVDAYIEPFVGGANIIDKIKFPVKVGYDKNKYLIALLEYINNDGVLPDTITEKEYYAVRDNKDNYPDWHVGLVGFCASYGGRFFEGYPRGTKLNGELRDLTNEAIRNLQFQKKNLLNIEFKTNDYINLNFHNNVIYCDPPYFGSKPYKTTLLGKFNHSQFWDWVSRQNENNIVLVSEYTSPSDYVSIWSKRVNNTLVQNTGNKQGIENLYIHKSKINLITL